MDLDISLHSDNVDWQVLLAQRCNGWGWAITRRRYTKKPLKPATLLFFVRHGGQLFGFGRAISDGVYQAAVYNVAVVPQYQGLGIGSTIIKHILRNVPNCNVILYAAPGKEHFLQQSWLSHDENRHGLVSAS
jgi:ribosomal protein S18 acetylase RimI-like enzyme